MGQVLGSIYETRVEGALRHLRVKLLQGLQEKKKKKKKSWDIFEPQELPKKQFYGK